MACKHEEDMEYFAMVRGENVRMVPNKKPAEKVISEARISIREAAELMCVTQQFLRIGLQRGIFPWGYALQLRSKRYTYFISRQKFCEAIGINENAGGNDA